MRYFKLLILFLAYALITPASAQTCCPAGCVNDFNPNRCVTTGPVQRTCNPVPCAGTGGSAGGSSGVPGSVVVYPRPSGPPCGRSNTTQQWRDDATNACLNALSANAQFWGCLFEDDAGRAEDQRTGLSCPLRQQTLANQCRKRCADWALYSNTCDDSDTNWQHAFGDIGGDHFGSARVDLCGPRLRDGFAVIKRRLPLTTRLP